MNKIRTLRMLFCEEQQKHVYYMYCKRECPYYRGMEVGWITCAYDPENPLYPRKGQNPGQCKGVPGAADVYLDAHLDRLIEATNDLWRQNNSICWKCHEIVGPMNCLFCYCPRYGMAECGGHYRIKVLEDGRKIKDCSMCTIPHQKEVVKAWLKERIYGSL